MSKREIFFGGGRPYRMCEIVYAEVEKSTIVGPYMIAREDSGAEHVVRQGYGTWCAMSSIDLVVELKERDRLRELVAQVPTWRPIADPPPEGDVLVATDTGAVGEARYHEGHGWYWAGSAPTDAHDGQIFTATRWMPLPAPPPACIKPAQQPISPAAEK